MRPPCATKTCFALQEYKARVRTFLTQMIGTCDSGNSGAYDQNIKMFVRCCLQSGRLPRVGLILGSGLAELAERIENAVVLSYQDLPGYPMTTVEGHVGRLVIGDWVGIHVACMQGRFHVYEGYDPAELITPIRALQAAGCELLLVTCAAGSLRE